MWFPIILDLNHHQQEAIILASLSFISQDSESNLSFYSRIQKQSRDTDEVPNFPLFSLQELGLMALPARVGSGDPHLPLCGLQFLVSTLGYQNAILSPIPNLLPSGHTGVLVLCQHKTVTATLLSSRGPSAHREIPQTCHPLDPPPLCATI